MPIEWVVGIAGGRGPDVWDDEFFVEGDTFAEASAKAMARVAADERGDCDIIFIEQRS